MENVTTPDVYHNDSYYDVYHNDSDYYEDEQDEDYDWNKIWKSMQIMSVVILSLVCVLGVLGNGVVIWATGFRMRKTISTVWYLNLAVADFLVTALLPLVITNFALDNWPFGWFMCKMEGLVLYMNMYASIYSLVVISVDRCVCVECPVWTQNHRTVKNASWVSLGVWVMALALSIPHFIFKYTKPSNSGDKVQCINSFALTTVAFIINFVVGFMVPFSIIVSCYSVIIYRLRNNRSLASKSGRSFKIIAAVIAAFFLCWIPFHIIRLIHVCFQKDLIMYSDRLYHVLLFGQPITLTLALINSCMNPLLYVFSQGCKDVFRCRSILKLLEKAFAEEPSQTSNTHTDPGFTRIVTLSEHSTDHPRTQDPSP